MVPVTPTNVVPKVNGLANGAAKFVAAGMVTVSSVNTVTLTATAFAPCEKEHIASAHAAMTPERIFVFIDFSSPNSATR